MAQGLKYGNELEAQRLLSLVENLAKTLNALIKSLKSVAA
jgi:hypothetical protein